MTTNSLQKIIRIAPAFDKRHSDPAKNYGIGSVRMLFVLKGKDGAISFSCSTGMYLPQQVSEHGHRPWREFQPMGYTVSSCAPVPKEGREGRKNCEWLDGKTCYGDGSALAADEVYDALIREGDDGVWRKLLEFYRSWLNPNIEDESSSSTTP